MGVSYGGLGVSYGGLKPPSMIWGVRIHRESNRRAISLLMRDVNLTSYRQPVYGLGGLVSSKDAADSA